MKILIVGGLGYLGPVVSSTIRDLLVPESLHVVDAGWFLAAAVSPGTSAYDRISIGDKRDLKADFLIGYDVVIDLAAVSNDPMGKDFEAATMEINAAAAVELAQKCKQAGVKRFIFASSCSIYGAAGDVPRRESDGKNPLTEYARSKWEAEQKLEMIADKAFGVTALRFATACGWSPHFRADLVLNDFVLTALLDHKIVVLSDGTPWRPLVHVTDIGRAIAWAAQDERVGFAAFNVGTNDWTLSIGDLASYVADIMGVPFEITNANGPDKRSYRVSFDKFEREAKGFLPRAGLRQSVEEIGDHLRPHLDRFKHFRDGPLMRLNVLREKMTSGELDDALRKQGKISHG